MKRVRQSDAAVLTNRDADAASRFVKQFVGRLTAILLVGVFPKPVSASQNLGGSASVYFMFFNKSPKRFRHVCCQAVICTTAFTTPLPG
jgi:hypothetical protein